MASKTNKKQSKEEELMLWEHDFAADKEEINLNEEILSSMKSYIDYQLVERALPYAYTGLKPVHTSMLWTLYKMKLYPNTAFMRSLAVSGECVAKYHPHSSDAAYMAGCGLTRQGGDDMRPAACMLNLSLISGKGNFGNEPGKSNKSAAPRYTGMKLSKTGMSCVEDVNIGAAYMKPTYDTENVIPDLLPVKLPLLLINGANGLAYGYNVFWLPHNPTEAINACLYRLDNPKCSIEDIKEIMPGPDFPTGGIIIDKEENGILDAYKTGFGGFTVTSRYEIIEETRGRHTIRFYETVYGIARSGDKGADKNTVVAGVRAFAQENPQFGITDIKNLSDSQNSCLVEVYVKAGINAEMVAKTLISPKSKTFLTGGMNYRQAGIVGDFIESDSADASGNEGVLRLSNEHPQDMNMLEYIDEFIKFRTVCITNASKYELRKALNQKHLVDGMLKALIDIDKVIECVRKSQNKETARKNLMKEFKLDQIQADYVLSIPLSRLTRSDRIQLEGNSKKLAAKAKELEKILSSKKNLLKEVRRQLELELETQILPRRTTIVSHKGKIIAKAAGDNQKRLNEIKTIVSTVIDEDVVIPANISNEESTSSQKQTQTSSLSTNKKVEKVFLTPDGQIGETADNFIQELTINNTDDEVLIIYADGSSTRIKTYEITSKPSLVGKKAIGIATYNKEKPINIAIATNDGKVKVLDTSTLTKNPDCDIMSLPSNSEILCARPVISDDLQFVFIASNANLLKFPVKSVPIQGKGSSGVAGIKLVKDSRVVAAYVVTDSDILVSTTNLSIKVTPLAEYPTKGRGSQGCRCHKFLKGETELVYAYVGSNPKRSDKKALPKPAGRDASGAKENGLNKISFSE